MDNYLPEIMRRGYWQAIPWSFGMFTGKLFLAFLGSYWQAITRLLRWSLAGYSELTGGSLASCSYLTRTVTGRRLFAVVAGGPLLYVTWVVSGRLLPL